MSIIVNTGARQDLGIVALGDSHLQGHAHLPHPPDVHQSPLDEMWTGSAVAAYFKGNSAVNVITGSLNPNLLVSSAYVSPLAEVLRALRSTGQFRRLRLVNLAVGGASTFDWAGEQARARLLINSQPNVGDHIVVNGQTYTFVDAATNPFEVTRDAAVGTCALRFANAVNLEGVGWGAGTTRNVDAFCQDLPTNGYCYLWAVVPGTGGNALTLTTDAGPRIQIDFQFTGGLNTSAIMTNAVARVPASFGAVDLVLIGLGTNDCDRPGWRGRGTQSCLQAAFADIATVWPSAQIVSCRPPVYPTSAYMPTVIAAVDAAHAATPTVTVADIYGVGAGSGDTATLDGDGVHLSTYGNSLAAQITAKACYAALGLA